MSTSPGSSSATKGNEPDCIKRIYDGQAAYSRAEDEVSRRNKAAGWMKSMLGDLEMSSEPSIEEFCSWLRSGLVLCKLMNKVQPGAVQKIIDNGVSPALPEEQVISCQGQSLAAYQYFVNVRNFIEAAAKLNLPTFESSDLEHGSMQPTSLVKIVDCILALKSYHEWKQSGSTVPWRCAGSSRSPMIGYLQSPPLVTMKHYSSAKNKRNCNHLILSEIGTPSSKELATDKVGPFTNPSAQDIFDHKENIDENLPVLRKLPESKGPTHSLRAVLPSEEKLDKSLEEKINDLVPSFDQHVCRGSGKGRQLIEQSENIINFRSLLVQTTDEMLTFMLEESKKFEALDDTIRKMSKAANGYQKVLDENKRLYNELQDLKGSIRVFCRVKPLYGQRHDTQGIINLIGDDGSLLLSAPKTGKESEKLFKFNKVFGPSSTQDEVYRETQSLIRCVMDGYNVCIFAYGQTGSGKTHTMSGPKNASEKELGVNYRALADLFEISQGRQEVMLYNVSVQIIEIYNEQVRDLLCKENTTKKIEIRNGALNDGFNVPEATLLPVNSPSDVLNLMNLGHRNRAVSSTALNDRSSRSHSVVTVHVEGKNRISGSTIHSCLHLVDLAGSERVDKSEVTGDRLKEAQHINKSLSALGDVIAALAQKNSHVPYRNSKLTQLLQDSLGGQAKTLMFVHISPEPESYAETVSTLKFAERVATVELGAAHSNKESVELRETKEQLEGMKRMLLKKDDELARRDAEIAQLKALKGGSPVVKPVRTRRTSLGTPRNGNSSNQKTGTNLLNTPENKMRSGGTPADTYPTKSSTKSMSTVSKIKRSVNAIAKGSNVSEKRSRNLPHSRRESIAFSSLNPSPGSERRRLSFAIAQKNSNKRSLKSPS